MTVERRRMVRAGLNALAAVSVWGTGLFALAPPAHAATPSCIHPRANTTGDYGQVVGRENKGGDPSKISGVRSRIWIASAAGCYRIASVTVINQVTGAQLEFGYVLGWINCTGTANTWTKYAEPTPFALWQYRSGTWDCRTFPNYNPPAGGWATFQSSDADHNGYWGSWYDGAELQPAGIRLQHSTGQAFVNMERGSSQDPGAAIFTSISEHYDAWSLFDGLMEPHLANGGDSDPNYRLQVVNGHEGKVIKQ